jgi:hypothetical protein
LAAFALVELSHQFLRTIVSVVLHATSSHESYHDAKWIGNLNPYPFQKVRVYMPMWTVSSKVRPLCCVV